MGKSIKNKWIKICIFHVLSIPCIAQTFGPELIIGGDFGTIETVGKNGDGGEGLPIYPDVNNPNIPVYYQPATRVYHNGYLTYVEINEGLTIGKPLTNNSSYEWGMNELWNSDAYFFPTTSGDNSYTVVPNAPNNGYYLIGTTTHGMYNLPSLNASAWYEIYDRYETNFANPTHYFLITNADENPTKIFFQGKVGVEAGQVYRMSADISRLNRSSAGGPPAVDFIISSSPDSITSDTPVFETGNIPDEGGQWVTYYFDYVVPCGVDTIYVAFRNGNEGGNGNDVAMDNLSMRAIYPQIMASIVQGVCDATLTLDGSIDGVLDSTRYELAWERSLDGGTTFSVVSYSQNYITNTPGIYRLSVYTAGTTACPMYSNTVELIDDSNGCVIIASPEAVTDVYQINTGQNLTANILINDIPSDSISNPEEVLRVTQFSVNDTIYPAGSQVVVYDASNAYAGVLRIEQDGMLTFESVFGYFGDILPINYTIVEEYGGGQDTAYIYIDIRTYAINLDYSCTCCPVTFSLLVPDTTTTDYSLYRYNTDELVTTGVIRNDSLYFTFYEPNAGIFYYTIYQGTEVLVSVPAIVSPDLVIWAPNTVINSRDWLEYNNWYTPNGYGYPKWCTDVIIPENAPYYPELQYQGYEQCRDILFENGAAISQVHKLVYRRAFVQYTPIREKWTMLSAPLKYIYSADFSADPTWGPTAGIDPMVYMRYFDIAYDINDKPNPDGVEGASTGSFSKAFSDLKEELTLGLGFALNVGTGSNAVFDGTFSFPRLNADSTEVLYKYHYKDDGTWVEAGDPGVPASKYPFRFTDAGEPGRGTDTPRTGTEWIADHSDPRGEDSRYRFIYETSPTVTPVVVTLPEAGTTNIIGNPFMSHIDFEALYTGNAAAMYNYYRIWNGSGFYSYITTGGMDNETTWSGLPEDDLANIYQGSRYIAPLQAFFVEMRSGQNEITFVPDDVAITPMDTTGIKLKSASGPENILRLDLEMDGEKSRALLAVLPLAKDGYDPEEDVYKLFAYKEETPEIYTVSDGEAIEINAVSDKEAEKLIPLGIKTTKTGEVKLSFEGIENLTAYPYIFLLDAKSGNKFNLREEMSVRINKDSEANIEGQLYLLLTKQANSIYENQMNNPVEISQLGNLLQITSPLSPVYAVEIADMMGRKVYEKENINSFFYTQVLPFPTGIYIVKVKTGKESVDRKIKL